MGLSPHGRGNRLPLRIRGQTGIVGLSPHGRGNHSQPSLFKLDSREGSIPARAGEPSTSARIFGRHSADKGLSPHGRGNLAGAFDFDPRMHVRVYPRTGGGTNSSVPYGLRQPWATGLSPHGRGNPDLSTRPSPSSDLGVYPRTGGGTVSDLKPTRCSHKGLSPHGRGNRATDAVKSCPSSRGLSPHGRGNPGDHIDDLDVHGSIPARAGEPSLVDATSIPGGVYPRTGGGTFLGVGPITPGEGLSPHGRGNHHAIRRAASRTGSIPARAGEPGAATEPGAWERVYPRTGGGTFIRVMDDGKMEGLSPHGRGNREDLDAGGAGGGSIPARAGEPCRGRDFYVEPRVYPRTGGGTHEKESVVFAPKGLSPHGRGNPSALPREPSPSGSIPARAGEPGSRRGGQSRRAVYPRTGGGTLMSSSGTGRGRGLSPHGRGNPGRDARRSGPPGSIPARAGEPHHDHPFSPYVRVYPRTGGGTRSHESRRESRTGLSPHGRGNRPRMTQGRWRSGSIPARAGEPIRAFACTSFSAVYPRTGGGTLVSLASGWLPGGLSPHGRGNQAPAD